MEGLAEGVVKGAAHHTPFCPATAVPVAVALAVPELLPRALRVPREEAEGEAVGSSVRVLVLLLEGLGGLPPEAAVET